MSLPIDVCEDLPTVGPCMSQEAMRKLYEMHLSNTLCDAKIIMDDKTVFNVHRAILCACSSFFSALFTTKLNPKDQNNFEIHEMSSEMMRYIIGYAYLRTVSELNEENVFKLYACADYCSTLGLMTLCVDYIISILKPENCLNINSFARFYNIGNLLAESRMYVLKNFVHVAKNSKELMDLNLDDFLSIICDDLLNVKDEQIVWECCVKWIDYDPKNRARHIVKILKSIRLGLLNDTYFMENVRNHRYVVTYPDTRPIILDTIKFLYDLKQFTDNTSVEMKTPTLAIPRLPHEVIFTIGGWVQGMATSRVESYDTRADRWVRILYEDPIGPRSYHGTAVVDQKIYVIGGYDGVEYFNTCRCFDPVEKVWTEIAPMHYRRCYVSVTVLNGLIYALGGSDGTVRYNTAEVYNPVTNQWSMIAPMHLQRSDADACVLNGQVYITGGFTGTECVNSFERYDPDTNTWSLLPHMLSRRSGVSCVAFQGCVYVIGGYNGIARLNSAEKYDLVKHTWTPIKEMYHPRSNFAVAIIDDMIFAIGGYNGISVINHTECYVPESNEWLEATCMLMGRSGLSASVLCGLPNTTDYLHLNRDTLMEERRAMVLRFNNLTTFEESEMGDDANLDNDDLE